MILTEPKVSLLRLQATQNCNLNCSYCYIPSIIRRQRDVMDLRVLRATLTRLVQEDLLEDRLSISWHGAEPLAAGLAWYESAFAVIDEVLGDRVRVTSSNRTGCC